MCFHLVIIMRCWEQTAHDTVWSGDVMTVYSLQTSPSLSPLSYRTIFVCSKLHHCSLAGILHFTLYTMFFMKIVLHFPSKCAEQSIRCPG